MVLIASLPVAMSSLLIAAHFYRNGMPVLAGICLLMPLLLAMKQKWVPAVLIFFLLLCSVEWFRTLVDLVSGYRAAGESYTRLSIILGTVILFNLLSTIVFRTKSMKRRYGRGSDEFLWIGGK